MTLGNVFFAADSATNLNSSGKYQIAPTPKYVIIERLRIRATLLRTPTVQTQCASNVIATEGIDPRPPMPENWYHASKTTVEGVYMINHDFSVQDKEFYFGQVEGDKKRVLFKSANSHLQNSQN